MNFAKRLLTLTGITALAVIGIVVITPKAVHAVAATLVQITNTAVNPVPNRDVDNPAAEPFSARLCQELGTYVNDCQSSSGTVPDQFVVPSSLGTGHAVRRLVLEFASGSCVATATQVYEGAIVVENNGTIVNAASIPVAASTSLLYSYAQPMRMYVDPGTTVRLAVGVHITQTGYGAKCNMNLEGHYVME